MTDHTPWVLTAVLLSLLVVFALGGLLLGRSTEDITRLAVVQLGILAGWLVGYRSGKKRR